MTFDKVFTYNEEDSLSFYLPDISLGFSYFPFNVLCPSQRTQSNLKLDVSRVGFGNILPKSVTR